MSSLRHKSGRHHVGAEMAMYRNPQLYDLAFGFRNIAGECDGLLELAARYGAARPKSVLELACGPAHHLRELARRGLECYGLDINREMLGYARALRRRDGVEVTLRRGDMRTFHLSRRFDVVLCLFDSFAQCTTERDAIRTLRSAAAALRRGGLMFLEFTHPADYFGKARMRSMNRWTQRSGDMAVKARFSVTRLNPVEETFVASLVIEPSPQNARVKERRLAMRWLQRMWLRGGISYVACASGRFDVVGWYGDIEPIVPLNMQARAWRMIAVLRRR